jgi:3-dehydroquinate dehydratase-2
VPANPRPRFVVLHGPNLNLLGEREPGVYGTASLADVDASLAQLAAALGVLVECHQANGEGALIEALHAARFADGIVVNPGGYTHTSVALHDAIRACPCPVVEVHLSNLYAREPFRHVSVTGAACVGVVMGLGANSYHLALRHLAGLSDRAST